MNVFYLMINKWLCTVRTVLAFLRYLFCTFSFFCFCGGPLWPLGLPPPCKARFLFAAHLNISTVGYLVMMLLNWFVIILPFSCWQFRLSLFCWFMEDGCWLQELLSILSVAPLWLVQPRVDPSSVGPSLFPWSMMRSVLSETSSPVASLPWSSLLTHWFLPLEFCSFLAYFYCWVTLVRFPSVGFLTVQAMTAALYMFIL